MNIKIENQSGIIRRLPRLKMRKLINRIVNDEHQYHNKLWKKFLQFNVLNKIEINFLFVNNQQMIKYNKQYFNRNKITDVIAFSMIEGTSVSPNSVLGDVIINAEIAQQDCHNYQHSFEEELLLLVIHSMMHLLGYEHKNECSLMRQREQYYFNRFVKKDRYKNVFQR